MIGIRLKEERERLGLTQPQFAEAAGAAKRTLIEWEKGSTSPSAVQLSALVAIGVDVLYVITGTRQPEFAPPDFVDSDGQPLTYIPVRPDEKILLANYRNSSADVKAALKAASGASGSGAAKRRKNG